MPFSTEFHGGGNGHVFLILRIITIIITIFCSIPKVTRILFLQWNESQKEGRCGFPEIKNSLAQSNPIKRHLNTANELPSGSATPEAPSWPAADGFATNDDDGLMSDIKLRRGKA